MSGDHYFAAAIETLQRLRESQRENVAAAAALLAEAIAGNRAVFSFGATHSFMVTEELVYRAGGLMLVNPISATGMDLSVRPLTATSERERIVGLGKEILKASPARSGDVLLLASTSGRNAVIIDMALAAREDGIKVIGVTSFAYTSGVTSRHPSGKKLADLCDVLLDNGAPLGDAAVKVEGVPQKVGPLSTIGSCAVVNALVAETVALLVRRGIEPPVFASANTDGGDALNARLLAANRHRIHYMGP